MAVMAMTMMRITKAVSTQLYFTLRKKLAPSMKNVCDQKKSVITAGVVSADMVISITLGMTNSAPGR